MINCNKCWKLWIYFYLIKSIKMLRRSIIHETLRRCTVSGFQNSVTFIFQIRWWKQLCYTLKNLSQVQRNKKKEKKKCRVLDSLSYESLTIDNFNRLASLQTPRTAFNVCSFKNVLNLQTYNYKSNVFDITCEASIYGAFDFNKKPEMSVAICIGAICLVPVSHLCWMGFAKLSSNMFS